MKFLGNVIEWLFGICFFVTGLVSIFQSPLVGLTMIAMSVLLLPPFRRLIHKKTNIDLPPKLRWISIFALFITTLFFIGKHEEDKKQQQLANQQAQEAARIAQIEQENINYFNKNKEQIIANANAALNDKNYTFIVGEYEKYLIVDDEQLKKIYNNALEKDKQQKIAERTASILSELKQLPASNLVKNRDLYQELVTINPDENNYQKKLSFYENKIKVVEQEELRAKQRQDLIEKQFSPWDGSHRNLESLIIEAMNDPDSYEHAKTVYWDKGDYLIVQTTYRGKNAFGGVVRNFVKAKVSLDGEILQILDES